MRDLLPLGLAPGEFLLGHGDQLVGRVGHHLVFQVQREALRPDRVADDGLVLAGVVSDDFLAEKLGVFLQGRRELLIGLARPPAELRIVAVVILEPVLQGLAEVSQPVRGAQDHDLVRLLRPLALQRFLRFLKVRADLRERRRRLLGIDGFILPARLLQPGDVLREAHERRHLGAALLLAGEQTEFVAQLQAHQVPVNPALGAEVVVGHCVQLRLPRLVEFAKATEAQGRARHRVEFSQVVAVLHEALDQLAQLARDRLGQRRQVRHIGLGRPLRLRRLAVAQIFRTGEDGAKDDREDNRGGVCLHRGWREFPLPPKSRKRGVSTAGCAAATPPSGRARGCPRRNREWP